MSLSPLGMTLAMQPQMTAPREGTVAPTDVLGAYTLATNAANQQYQAKLQQQNAMWGGLAGLGAAGVLAAPNIYKSGMLNGLFTPAASSAATTAAGGTPLSILPSGLSAVAPASDALDATMLGYGGLGADTLAGAVDPSVLAGADSAAALGTDALASTAADATAAAGADAAADAGAFSLADILPFLFAA